MGPNRVASFNAKKRNAAGMPRIIEFLIVFILKQVKTTNGTNMNTQQSTYLLNHIKLKDHLNSVI